MWTMRDDADSLSLRVVPHNTMVYEVSGPLFFGAADKILKITLDEKMNCLVLRMRSVSAIDATAMHNLEQLYTDCKKKNIQIVSVPCRGTAHARHGEERFSGQGRQRECVCTY